MFTLSRTIFTLPRIAAAAGLLATGGGIGAAAIVAARPAVVMAAPAPLSSAAGDGAGEGSVTVRGEIADVFGGRFIVKDGSGRVLVDAGSSEAATGMVAIAQTVTVQGRLEDELLQGLFLIDAEGHVIVLDRNGRAHRRDSDGRLSHQG